MTASLVFFIMIIIFYQTLHRKLKIEQHDPHEKPVMKTCATTGLAVPVPQYYIIYILHRFQWYIIFFI